MPELVRYSTLKKKMNMRFLKKKYTESDYSILYDIGHDNEKLNHALLGDVKNLVIDKTYSTNSVYISDIGAKNIFFLDSENLGGMTISFKSVMESNRGYYFDWSTDYLSNIDKINIIFKDNKVKSFNVNNLNEVNINRKDYSNKISLTIVDNKKVIEYIMDELGNIEDIKIKYYLTKEDIENNIIDLSDFIDYKEIHVDINNDVKVKELILNKKCMKELNKIYDVLSYIHYDKLKIIDDNDMKLFPNVINVKNDNPKNRYVNQNIFVSKDGNNKYYILIRKNNEKLIYLDNLDNIKIIDKDKLLNNKDIKDVKFYLEDKFKRGIYLPITIIKYKNNKYKISYYDESIEISKLFTEFNLYNIYAYYSYDRKEVNDLLINNDWYNMYEKGYMDWYKLKRIYEDFLVFVNHIKKLKSIGLSFNAIRYLYENHYNNLTNTKKINNVDNLKYQDEFNINEITNDEINAFNILGRSYVKRKRISRCSNERKEI